MKNKYIHFILIAVGMMVMACEENPDYFDLQKAPSMITFEGYPDYSATFATTDDITIPVTATNAGEITVDRRITYPTTINDKDTTLTVRSQIATLTGPEAVLNTTWETILANPQNVGPDAITAIDIIFVTTVNGQQTSRSFSLDFTSPISDVEAPETAFYGSDISINYKISSLQSPIQKVDFFTKIGDGAYGTTPVKTVQVNAPDFEDSVSMLTFPSEAQIKAGTKFTVQLVATAANGMTATETVDITAANMALEITGEATLRTAGYQVEVGVLDSLSQAFDFSQNKVLKKSTINAYPDSADVRLVVEEDLFGIKSLSLVAGGQTTFVAAGDTFSFESASYETVRDAFAAGIAVDQFENIATLPSQQVILVKLGDVADGNSKQYAVMQIADVVKGFDINQSEVTIMYMAR